MIESQGWSIEVKPKYADDYSRVLHWNTTVIAVDDRHYSF